MAVNKRAVHGFFVGFLAVLAIDAFHAVGAPHQDLKDAINPALVTTGLWQGPWRLYGPEVDKVNLRFMAEVAFADGAVATWNSPDWTQMSAPRKFVHARDMNYFGYLLRADAPAWDALCAYLARTVRHPAGKPVAVAQVTLAVRGALIPSPDDKLVPPGPYLVFDPWDTLRVWRPAP
ncbi:MAG TPA: hypothetical protein VFP84_20425 [Kofleriaceae bacterium]|nr:hypothetical protein [Kofleriaceae bacterium]